MIMYKRAKRSIVDPIKEMIGDEYYTREEVCFIREENYKHYQIGGLHIKKMYSYEMGEEHTRTYDYFYITAPDIPKLKGCYIKYDEAADEGVIINSNDDEICRKFPVYDDYYFNKEPEDVEKRINEIVSEFEGLVKAAHRSHKEKQANAGITELTKKEDLLEKTKKEVAEAAKRKDRMNRGKLEGSGSK